MSTSSEKNRKELISNLCQVVVALVLLGWGMTLCSVPIYAASNGEIPQTSWYQIWIFISFPSLIISYFVDLIFGS